jgi:hypothetical protein
MPEITTLRNPQTLANSPSGAASLRVRERYLRKRSARRRFGDRAMTILWVGVGAVVSWLFVVGFSTLTH